LCNRFERKSRQEFPAARKSAPCSRAATGVESHSARKLKRAQILLAAGAGTSDEQIARSVGVGGSTVYRTKRSACKPAPSAATSRAGAARPGAAAAFLRGKPRQQPGRQQVVCDHGASARMRRTLRLVQGIAALLRFKFLQLTCSKDRTCDIVLTAR
jgi:hypothetical protein